MRRRLARLLGALARAAAKSGPMRPGLEHFLKVSRSFWPGLFQCYDHPELPRTNNDLEQVFGSYRHYQRRVTGHKVASAGTVLRGPVRLVAATATCCHTLQGHELAPADILAWRSLRRQIEQRRHARTLGRRFRRHPEAYLKSLERLLKPKSGLPP
jgi:hypothetical protein